MRDKENIEALIKLKPDIIGFIYSPDSKRFVGYDFEFPKIDNIQKAGVFVNSELDLILAQASKNTLDIIQLHGDESPEMCKNLKDSGFYVIKVFRIGPNFSFFPIESYLDSCDAFLFDTDGKTPGGNGYHFDWKIMDNYPYSKEFFLSGGLGPEDALEIKRLKHPLLTGIDINSRFEIQPGVKNIENLKQFIHDIRE